MPTLSDTLSFINQYFWYIVIIIGVVVSLVYWFISVKEAPHNDTPFNCNLCKNDVGIVYTVHNKLICQECEEKISRFMSNPMNIKDKEERDNIIKFLNENKGDKTF